MGLFDVFKKSKPNVTVKVSAPVVNTVHVETFPSRNGLSVGEDLLLFYCRRGAFPLKEGKETPRFWSRTYEIQDVSAALTALAKKGFIFLGENGKYALTPLGEQECAENEYIEFMHNHSSLSVSLPEMNTLVAKNPGSNYKDLLWGALNQKLTEYAQAGKDGLYSGIRHNFAQLGMEDGRYKDALFEFGYICFLSINSKARSDNEDLSRNLAPGIIKGIKSCAEHLNISAEELERFFESSFQNLFASDRKLSNKDTAKMIVDSVCKQ